MLALCRIRYETGHTKGEKCSSEMFLPQYDLDIATVYLYHITFLPSEMTIYRALMKIPIVPMFELLPQHLPAKTHFSHRSQRGKIFRGLQARILRNGLHESRVWACLGVSCWILPQPNELAKCANPLASLVFGVRY